MAEDNKMDTQSYWTPPESYREFEMYLEKVTEEISAVFERWQHEDNEKTANAASSPTEATLRPKEVANFLRKVEDTILGQDAGTQTQDLSPSSSVIWLSSSSLLDSTRSTTTDETSSSSEALLSAESNVNTLRAGSDVKNLTDSDSQTSSQQFWPIESQNVVGGGELYTKSSSAPILTKTQIQSGAKGILPTVESLNLVRSHSDRRINEIEAVEACRWMRAAGFPQYAQMYEDCQFPIDMSSVEKDHPFLDDDALQALFRRLSVLNKCAKLKFDGAKISKNTVLDSDDDDECAISENWTFLHQSRRWSRIAPNQSQGLPSSLPLPPLKLQPQEELKLPEESVSSQENKVTEENKESDSNSLYNNNTMMTDQRKFASLPPRKHRENDTVSPSFRRSGSEKLRDGAKAILRRVESFKSKCKQKNEDYIGKPEVIDKEGMEERIRKLNCIDLTPSSCVQQQQQQQKEEEEDTLTIELDTFSDSDLPKELDTASKDIRKKSYRRRSQQNYPIAQRAATIALDVPRLQEKPQLNSNLGKSDGECIATISKTNTYDLLHKKRPLKLEGSEQKYKTLESPSTSNSSKSSTVTRWHSFRSVSESKGKMASTTVFIHQLSCGQLMVLKKLAMLRLTAIIEKYCPAIRSTTFNWEFPKFIKKSKSPIGKEQFVFKISLLTSVQKTGQALPPAIQAAVQHLIDHALDQVGLFRKPGVKSRIQKLKAQMIETGLDTPLELSSEEQQCYDIADLIKQFFRELPEALLTEKLSDTFLSIFLYVPESYRLDAVRSAVFLLPDQHREVLQYLLEFLQRVATHSDNNQMTGSNLAVCLAPSLFSQNTDYDAQRSSSPRNKNKKKSKMTPPDTKEFVESKAAQDCITFLLAHIDDIFTISAEMMSQCKFSSMDQSKILSLDELGADMNNGWKDYMQACIASLLKEVKEKGRNWISINNCDFGGVEIAYKKVTDGHPLRLWKVSTEVEAPPAELLHRILRQQHIWDPSLMNCQVLATLDACAEVFDYTCGSMDPLPPRDYCVLRYWKSDLPKGACVLVETSIDYPGRDVGAVQAIVLASRYLIEPCGSGKSRLLHLSRIDLKGRKADWYNKCYGHMCALNLSRIRDSFKHQADGPESNV